MMIVSIVTHALSGLLLTMVGSARLANPIKAYSKNSGINLEKDVNLLNEVKGVSALMLCGGVLSILGIFIAKLNYIAFVACTLIFLGFAIGRIISWAVDGKPNKQIVQGLVFEIVFGGLNLYCLMSIS